MGFWEKVVELAQKELNQNLLTLIVAMIALGFSEKYPALFLPAVVLTWIMVVSVTATMTTYTIHYCKRKLAK